MAWRIWRGGTRGGPWHDHVGTPQDAPDGRRGAVAAQPDSAPRGQMPRWLQTAAGWSWRLRREPDPGDEPRSDEHVPM
jgi:hypothetical protein